MLVRYLPHANVWDSLPKRTLKDEAKFESIASDFDEVIYKGTNCSEWKS